MADSDNPRRIGVVRTESRACERFADGSWRVTVTVGPARADPEMARWITDRYAGRFGPADGDPGVAALYDLADWLDGTVELDPRPESPPDTVY